MGWLVLRGDVLMVDDDGEEAAVTALVSRSLVALSKQTSVNRLDLIYIYTHVNCFFILFSFIVRLKLCYVHSYTRLQADIL